MLARRRKHVTPVRPAELPPDALLQRYRADGHYTDCYATEIGRAVSLAEYVAAFYTTWLFRLERWILRVAVSRPSSDADAAALARGEREDFAAWTVEARRPDELLLTEFTGRTRSWLRATPAAGGTRLYFGSAVTTVRDPETGRAGLGAHGSLLPLHRLYSRRLLAAARRRLLR